MKVARRRLVAHVIGGSNDIVCTPYFSRDDEEVKFTTEEIESSDSQSGKDQEGSRRRISHNTDQFALSSKPPQSAHSAACTSPLSAFGWSEGWYTYTRGQHAVRYVPHALPFL